MRGKLIEEKRIIEANFIFSLWSEPDLYGDYKGLNAKKDLHHSDSKFYYQLGKAMYELDFSSFDNTAIYTYLDTRDALKGAFEKLGGYQTVKEMLSITKVDNIGAYHDKLVKNNILINMIDKGFSIEKDYPKLKNMTSGELYDFYEYHLNDVFSERKDNIEIEDMIVDDEFIAQMQSGQDVGASYSTFSPRLSYATLGVPKGELMLMASYVNNGKTSFTSANIFLDLLDRGHKVAFVSNEQGIENFKRLMVLHILTTKFDYWKLTRKKLKIGKFTEDEIVMLRKARDYSSKHYLNNVKFARLYNYDMNVVKKIIKKLAKVGYEYFVYDVLKSNGTEEDYRHIIESTKTLHQLASKENIGIIPIMQLALHTKKTARFLDVDSLGGAKGASEVPSEIIIFREVLDDEKEGEKFDIKPYNYSKNSDGTTNYKMKVQYTMKVDVKYMVFFLAKTRNDDNGLTLLYEYKGDWNRWDEVGYCHVSQTLR